LPRLFSAYVIVDWSAASKPTTGADSVWIGVLKRDVRFRMAFESYNPPTRGEAEKRLTLILDDLKKRSERALVGFDFPLGFPRGFASALKLPGEQPWRAAWDQLDKMVKDKADNTNNRFGVASEVNRRLTGGPFPFWGCPPKDALTTLQPKRTRAHGPDDLPEFRHTEVAAKGAASIWKLYYNGSVGGQPQKGNGPPVIRRLISAPTPKRLLVLSALSLAILSIWSQTARHAGSLVSFSAVANPRGKPREKSKPSMARSPRLRRSSRMMAMRFSASARVGGL